jgi:imidazolonepropionase-like amidohydrolase
VADITATSPNSAAEPITEASSAFIHSLLAGSRVAGLRARIVANEIEAMTVALSAGMISAETALLHLHETGAAGLIPASSAIAE